MFTKPRPAAELVKSQTIVKHYAGSLAYGTNLPTSDVDFRGIFCADPIHVRTPFFLKGVETYEDKTEEDTVYHELLKFMQGALDCNPNVVETLWVDMDDVVVDTDAYQHLRAHRFELLSQKIAHTTSGYALSQLKRIKGHNKWINNPQPIDPPKQTDYVSLVFNLMDRQLFKRDFKITDFQYGYRLIPYGQNIFGLYKADKKSPFNGHDYSLNTVYDDETDFHTRDVSFVERIMGTSHRVRPIAIVKYNKDVYEADKENHRQYWYWKEHRNEKRSELEEQFGYDTKHAMHLVRLLRMGEEVLTSGHLQVKRPDAQELLDIRAGKLQYDEIVDYATDMNDRIKKVLINQTDLPKAPNKNLCAKLIMQVQDMVWQKNNT